jgi:kynurenine formamidase
MIVSTHIHQRKFEADLTKPIDISLTLREGLLTNPSCYWAEGVDFQTISMGSFVGSVKAGGSVNYQKLVMTPHGNGTHTECFGHISDDPTATIHNSLTNFHFTAQLISVTPQKEGDDSYVALNQIQHIFEPGVQAVIIRTLPNELSKKSRQYSGTNPPYLQADLLTFLASQEVDHILIDLPSLDKEVDGGKLAAHKAFWKFPYATRKQATVTELVFIDNTVTDGLYLLNLQIISLSMDASPSKPILYKLAEVL